MRRSLALVAALALSAAVEAEEPMPVAIELVLAFDVSASVDPEEFRLQLDGLVAALRDRDVIQAIENLGPAGAAIAVVQWGGPRDTQIVVPFTHVTSAREVRAIAHVAGLVQRWYRATSTSIAAAMRDSRLLIESNGFEGERKVIDISGDGPDNTGYDLAPLREQMRRSNITVNGLAIEQENATLTTYFRDHVITGPGSFVETARDYEDYARAIREKLLRELRPLSS